MIVTHSNGRVDEYTADDVIKVRGLLDKCLDDIGTEIVTFNMDIAQINNS